MACLEFHIDSHCLRPLWPDTSSSPMQLKSFFLLMLCAQLVLSPLDSLQSCPPHGPHKADTPQFEGQMGRVCFRGTSGMFALSFIPPCTSRPFSFSLALLLVSPMPWLPLNDNPLLPLGADNPSPPLLHFRGPSCWQHSPATVDGQEGP